MGDPVVTEAGTDPSVVGLVYVAAHMPDAGESEHEDGMLFPSDLSKSDVMKTRRKQVKFLEIQSSPRGESSDSITLTKSFIEACQVR
jgi:hypothetical protein